LEEGGEGRQERCKGGHALVPLIKALDDVPDERIVRDRRSDISERIGGRFLLQAVGSDGLVALLDVAEFLPEVAGASLLVVAEEGGDAREDGEGDGTLGHDHVDDVGGDGAVQPAQDSGVDGSDGRGDVVSKGILGDGNKKKIAPLGKVGGFEV
jgi:hypothetical protein